jgi:hypothetical protein
MSYAQPVPSVSSPEFDRLWGDEDAIPSPSAPELGDDERVPDTERAPAMEPPTGSAFSVLWFRQ